MLNRKWLIVVALLASPLAALAESQEQLVDQYTALAGSKDNATSLVTGLRDGKQVTLTRGTTKETFTPPTGKMGYGNVENALALAEASLKKQGITNPTPAQLEASVMKVLTMRADGKGWGQIAQSYGVKLGDVKRSERPERVGKVDRPHRPEKPQKPERLERPAR